MSRPDVGDRFRAAAVAFTDSNEVGETLRIRLVPRNVRFQGELGGKNVTVVLADSDLEVAVDVIKLLTDVTDSMEIWREEVFGPVLAVMPVSGLDEAISAVDTTSTGWDVHHPFGGFRQSGSPFKEQGEEALPFYTRVKAVAIRLIG